MELFGKIQASAPSSIESYIGAFQAAHRLLTACNNIPVSQSDDFHCGQYRERCGVGMFAGSTENVRHAQMRKHRGGSLTDIAHVGPCLNVAAFLDMTSLSQLDVTCHIVRELNRSCSGPWFNLGLQKYRGIELSDDGAFQFGDELNVCNPPMASVDWKRRAAHFHSGVHSFRTPYDGPRISEIRQADEIAYCRCQLRTDVLMELHDVKAGGRLFLEFEIGRNPDNVSLAVFDFEEGGCSSVTFSPDTGAVIRERKVNETPRKVEGAYIQPLDAVTEGQCFEGSMGLYFSGGHLAFFRRRAASIEAEQTGEHSVASQIHPWETTGFVTDLSWAEGRRLTPCLAFRNEGAYEVTMVSVRTEPPITPERNTEAYQENNWNSLDWDATEQDDLEAEA